MRPLIVVFLFLLAAWPAASTLAQEPPPAAPPPSFEQLQATIARMQKQVESMGQAAAERDKALGYLSQQVDKATGQISGSGQTNDSLRGQTATLSDQLSGVSAERDRLADEAKTKAGELGDVQRQLASLEQALGQERQSRAGLEDQLARSQAQVAELTNALATERQEHGSAAGELEQARAEIATLHGALEGQKQQSAESGQALAQARDQVAALTRSLDEARNAGQASAGELSAARERAAALEQELTQARNAANADAQRVQAELITLRGENEALKGKLAESTDAEAQKEGRIADLDRQLKEAMAQKVEELSQYRSEFFGRLRQLLGDRPDIRVVGDRFVFQSELLFASGSATLDPQGEASLQELAQSLREVAAKIPPDIDWVLRVDGHTDRLPVRYGPFTSNWQLSTARAISVVQFLIRAGIPPEHLAAAGFAEFRPLDPHDDEIAYRRNRRIEFKLTEG